MAAGRATETSDSDWASCRRVRICLVSTDRRPLRRVDLQARDEDPLLAATVNMQYAARHDYAFVLTSYRAAALDGRAYGWSKVAVLGELMDTWPEVEAFAFLDADASINTARRLENLPAVGRFLSNPERLVFFVNSDASRAGPPSKWASWTDEHGRLPSRQEYATCPSGMRICACTRRSGRTASGPGTTFCAPSTRAMASSQKPPSARSSTRRAVCSSSTSTSRATA
jgi:hypothetical protein